MVISACCMVRMVANLDWNVVPESCRVVACQQSQHMCSEQIICSRCLGTGSGLRRVVVCVESLRIANDTRGCVIMFEHLPRVNRQGVVALYECVAEDVDTVVWS